MKIKTNKELILNNFDDAAELHKSANHFFGFNRIMGIQKPKVSKVSKVSLPVDEVAAVAKEVIAAKKKNVQQKLKAYDHKLGHILDIKG